VCTTSPGITGVVQEAGVPARDLDQAEPARAEGVDHVGRAELWNLGAGLHRRAHDRGALGHRDLIAVDGQRDHRLGFGFWRAEIDFLDQRHRDLLLFRGLQPGRCGT
jgi:hypothetical protein